MWLNQDFYGTSLLLVVKLCLTFCDATNFIPPGSIVHRISQARVLEWVAIFLLQDIILAQG